VGLSIDDARMAAATIPGIEVIRELGLSGNYTFDNVHNRVTVLVVDDVVAAAAGF
jgi:hypothetical protein